MIPGAIVAAVAGAGRCQWQVHWQLHLELQLQLQLGPAVHLPCLARPAERAHGRSHSTTGWRGSAVDAAIVVAIASVSKQCQCTRSTAVRTALKLSHSKFNAGEAGSCDPATPLTKKGPANRMTSCKLVPVP